MRLAHVWMAAAAAAWLGCTDLPVITPGICGNGVLEPGEDCDGVGPEGAACAAPDEAHGCELVCSEAACPTGWACGLSAMS